MITEKKEVPSEVIERQGLSSEIAKKLARTTKAGTYSGYLLSNIKKLKDAGNLDAALLTETYYNKFIKDFSPKKLNKIEIIDGWKGKGNLTIHYSFSNDFIIIEHIKDKDGEVKKVQKTIPKENVNLIRNIIKDFNLNEEHKCYEFAEPLGFDSWKDLWRERKIYFSRYYYPVKVLEALKLIKYGGRGQITRLK